MKNRSLYILLFLINVFPLLMGNAVYAQSYGNEEELCVDAQYSMSSICLEGREQGIYCSYCNYLFGYKWIDKHEAICPDRGSSSGDSESGNDVVNTYPQGTREYTSVFYAHLPSDPPGVLTIFSFYYTVTIQKRNMVINAFLNKPFGQNVTPWGRADVVSSIRFSRVLSKENTQDLTTDQREYIGKCSIPLPPYGSVSVDLVLGVKYDDTENQQTNYISYSIYPY